MTDIRRDLVYGAYGERTSLDACLPEGDGLRPGVVLIHGGGSRGGSKDGLGWYGQDLAGRGFVGDHEGPAARTMWKAAVPFLEKSLGELSAQGEHP